MGNSDSQPKEGSASHEHTLFHHYVEPGTTKQRCDVCKRVLYGVVYACEVCKFSRHRSCFKKQMPLEITHPCHPMHKLSLDDPAEGYSGSDFLCERCFHNSRGTRYHCGHCLIDFDLACVSSSNDQEDQGRQIVPAGRKRKTRTKHFSHGEPLALFKYRKTTKHYELDCNWCDKRLSGMSYGCFKGGPYGCEFFLHESCISKIPQKLQHPFHPRHHLYMQYYHPFLGFNCNACKRPFLFDLIVYYACHECSFYLHLSCAGLLPAFKHKCHRHSLSYFPTSDKERFNCNACGQDCNARNNKEGAFYRCVQCNFNIHFKCLPAPPVAKHRYHRHFLTLHPGIVEDDSGEYYCDICEEERNPKHHIYYCKRCAFIAHVECVLKEVSDSEVREMMDLVKRVQQNNGNFRRLKQPDGTDIDRDQFSEMKEIQFLLKDLEQEKKEIKKEKYYERDDDTSSSSSSNDEENEKSDDNEEEGNEEEEEEDSKEKVEEDSEEKEEEGSEKEEEEDEEREEEDDTEENEEEDSKEKVEEDSEQKEEEDGEKEEEDNEEEEEIEYAIHGHPLRRFHLTEKQKDFRCNACLDELNGTVYICQTCSFLFPFGLHEACFELPLQLEQHPLHPQHSLTLLSRILDPETCWFICDECRDLSCGFVYLCMDCQFKVDVKCAVLDAPKFRSQLEPKHREINDQTKYLHFSHKHKLNLVNLGRRSILCNGCNLPIKGPAYCCLECLHIIHESCFRLLPKEIQHPFHPLHPLVAILDSDYGKKCHACKMEFDVAAEAHFIRYGCLQCQFDIHFECANSLRKVLKSSSHQHDLYYFGPDSQLFLRNYGVNVKRFNFLCGTCNEICEGPFYRCVECAINFHLKCVPVPEMIESRRHIHQLTLKDSFVEDDDSGEYFCDVCEEERHPKDHVYYCEQCEGHFVAHIECVVAHIECVLPLVEEFAPAEVASSSMHLNFEDTSIQAKSEESTDEWSDEELSD